MFGTFQEELESEPPVYGVLKPVSTWNPIFINFQHAYHLFLDAYHTKRLKDKFRLWFMPTGWRPDDVKDKYPRFVTKDINNRKKYKLYYSLNLKIIAAFSIYLYEFFSFFSLK